MAKAKAKVVRTQFHGSSFLNITRNNYGQTQGLDCEMPSQYSSLSADVQTDLHFYVRSIDKP